MNGGAGGDVAWIVEVFVHASLVRVAISRLPRGRFGPLRWEIALDLDNRRLCVLRARSDRESLTFFPLLFCTVYPVRTNGLYPYMHPRLCSIPTGAP
jgi:hypothetical protein